MIENMTIEELVSEIQGHLTKSRHRPSTPDLIWLRQISACVFEGVRAAIETGGRMTKPTQKTEKVEPVAPVKQGQAKAGAQVDYERWLLTWEELIRCIGHEPLAESKFISYGEMGTGKSSFWSTCPGGSGRGNLVLMFDATAKALPYLRGLELEHGETQWDPGGHLPPIRHTDCYYPSGDFWGRVEYYEELDADYPLCYETFSRYRAPYLRDDLIESYLGFVPYFLIIDSLTTMQLSSLRFQEGMNAQYKDPRLWFGDMKRD
jgi:hypothetical protein